MFNVEGSGDIGELKVLVTAEGTHPPELYAEHISLELVPDAALNEARQTLKEILVEAFTKLKNMEQTGLAKLTADEVAYLRDHMLSPIAGKLFDGEALISTLTIVISIAVKAFEGVKLGADETQDRIKSVLHRWVATLQHIERSHFLEGQQ